MTWRTGEVSTVRHQGSSFDRERFVCLLQELHSRHYGPLLRLASLYLDGAGEDAVQEAFAGVLAHWDKILDEDKLLAYLRRAVLNNAKSELRRRQTVRRHQPDPAGTSPPSEDVALRRISDQVVIECLRNLPARQAACVGLRFYLDLSEKQTAEVLEISAGSVKQHTSRALKKLGPVLEAAR